MKLRFRIPDEDEEEQRPGPPEESDDGPDLEELTPKVLTLAAAAAATQAVWPVPWPYLLLFGVLGAGVGASWLLRIGKWGTMAGVIMWTLFDFFTPAGASLSFILRTACVFIAAFGLTIGVGIWVQRRRAEE